MNAKEFAALAKGDVVENGTGQRGVIVDVPASGVQVRWGNEHSPSWPVAYHSTVWYGWTVIKPEDDQ